jgi:hypothetical protein
MVAANFRKEVTNTALWLMQFGIRVQCFKVTPYRFGEDVFVDIRQVIPTPEAESYMIGMAQKEAEEQSTSGELQQPMIRAAFWTMALEKFRTSPCSLFNNRALNRSLAGCGSGVSGVPFELIFSQKDARVQLNISRGDALENTWLFERLRNVKRTLNRCLASRSTGDCCQSEKAARSSVQRRLTAAIKRSGLRLSTG